MKLSEAWLREWVNPALTTDELAAQLTMLGLEVDAILPAAADFTGVCVGLVKGVEPHPEAEKLRVCQVDVGGSELTIVCGAPNVRPDLLVPVAQPGAVLPGNIKIETTKLRGVTSQGMLCSEKELGLSEASGGLMELAADASPGADLRQYLALNDQIIEIDLTPNRGDCLSIRGVARELAARNNLTTNSPQIVPANVHCNLEMPVRLTAAEACPKYLGRVIKNINPQAQSPQWLREKLRRSGIRSISPAVDVTSYVMLELGQPMHAYDLDKLSGHIEVRWAKAGETLELLDGSRPVLDDDTLLIVDQQGPIGIAGVMGGQGSAVAEATQNILLEAAFFEPLSVVGRARRYGLNTDAAYRFERGVDPLGQQEALERATDLLIAIVGGESGPVFAIEAGKREGSTAISLRASRITRLLGMAIDHERVETILRALGAEVRALASGEWQVVPPSWRFDLRLEADLIEELARIHGYNSIPRSYPVVQPRISRSLAPRYGAIQQCLTARAYEEAITYSFIDNKLHNIFNPNSNPLTLANPISSELSVMRGSLYPGLVMALQRNLHRQQSRVRLFEIGMVFVPAADGQLSQEVCLGGIVSGPAHAEQWSVAKRDVDFFDIKGDFEAALSLFDSAGVTFEPGERPGLHPTQTAILMRNGDVLGWIGRLHPAVERDIDLPQSALVFELNLSKIQPRALAKFTEISRFPSIRRDIAVVVDASVQADSILRVAKAAGSACLKDVILFDLYCDQALGSGRKSIALGLILQELSRTLTELEVDEIRQQVLTSLQRNLGATLRES